MAIKPFNVAAGLSVGPNVANVIIDTNNNDSNVANYSFNTTGYGNVTLGAVGNIHISGGAATQATLGAVTVSGGQVTAIAITSGGSGYDIPPVITISGSNSMTATATAVLTNGVITSFMGLPSGTGYTAATAAAAAPGSKYLQTDGAGNLTWHEVQGTGGGAGGTPSGSNATIQYNDNGVFGGASELTYNNTNGLTTFGANANSQVLIGNVGNIAFTSNNGTAVKKVTIQSSTDANFSANYTLTLPVNDGSNGQALTTDGSGVLAWSNISTSSITNGNSNVVVAANANVTIASNGQANLIVISSDGTNGAMAINGNVTFKNANGTIGFVEAANTANASLATIQGGVGTNGNGIILTTGSAATDGVQLAGSGRIQATNGSAALILNDGGNVKVARNLEIGALTANSGLIFNANTFQTTIYASNAAEANYSLQLPSNVAQYNNQVLSANTDGTTRFVTLSTITTANGNSSVSVTANANVTITANSNTVVAITSSGDGNAQTTGGNVTGYWNVSGNVVGANLVGTLANGNSNIRIAANGGVGISATGQSNIFAITSNGTHATTIIQNDVTVTGNLVVSGNAIYANTESLTIEDPIIELGTGANGSILTTNDGKDRGVELHTYGNGASYTTSGSTPSGNTTIVLSSTSGIVAGQLVTYAANPNAIAAGTTVSTVNAGNIVVSSATLDVIASGESLAIGTDILRFMGWSNANAEFQFYSNATVTNEVVSGTLGNVNANTFIGALKGNLVNGNSNVTVAANANVQIAANGNSVAIFTSSGDGNLQTTGANVVGYVSATGNVIATGNVQSNNNVVLENSVTFATDYSNTSTYFSNVAAATLTTTTTTANQALATVTAVSGRAVEFIVKAVDSTGAKYYGSTILALAGNVGNADLDYSTYATLAIGTTPGAITVALTDSNANITLQVTPSSTNSTVWTTQYRVI